VLPPAGRTDGGRRLYDAACLARLELVVTLLIVGLIAAVLGFGGIAGASFAMAKVIFFIVLVLLLISIVSKKAAR